LLVENLKELLAWVPTNKSYIIEGGLLLPETAMVIFGPAKSWKSMQSIHTAFTISQGLDWFGYKTTKATTLIYQVELPKAVQRNRIDKYAKYSSNNLSNIFFKTSQYTKIDTAFGFSDLEKCVNEVLSRSPGSHLVLILDPVYKLMQGNVADEQDTKKFTDNLDNLRARYGISIILVHHSRKQRVDDTGKVISLGAEDMFGGVLQKWCDTAVGVKLVNPFSSSDRVLVTFDLVRHAENVLDNFEVQWDRNTLQPSVTRVIRASTDEPTNPSIRELI
jgi:hypothetical protein